MEKKATSTELAMRAAQEASRRGDFRKYKFFINHPFKQALRQNTPDPVNSQRIKNLFEKLENPQPSLRDKTMIKFHPDFYKVANIAEGTYLSNVVARDNQGRPYIIQLNPKRKTYLYQGYGNNFVKTGSVSNFIDNRKEDWEQLKYLTKHKYDVYKAGREMDAPRLQLLAHDHTKFYPSNWTPYREYWFGEKGVKSKSNNVDPEVLKNFKEAVQRHYHAEKHHSHKVGVEADSNTKKEMLADWYAVSKHTKPNTPDFKTWVNSSPHTKKVYKEIK